MTAWPGGIRRSLYPATLPGAVWLWWRAGCKSGTGRTRRATNAAAPRYWPTACTLGIPGNRRVETRRKIASHRNRIRSLWSRTTMGSSRFKGGVLWQGNISLPIIATWSPWKRSQTMSGDDCSRLAFYTARRAKRRSSAGMSDMYSRPSGRR